MWETALRREDNLCLVLSPTQNLERSQALATVRLVAAPLFSNNALCPQHDASDVPEAYAEEHFLWRDTPGTLISVQRLRLDGGILSSLQNLLHMKQMQILCNPFKNLFYCHIFLLHRACFQRDNSLHISPSHSAPPTPPPPYNYFP